MQEVEPNPHKTARELLDLLVGKRLTSISRRIFHDPDETACVFEWLTGLELRFGRHVIHIDVDPNDDTLLISKAPREDDDTLIIDGSSHPLWRPILGKPLMFAWTMINSRGYLDGLAFAFETYAPSATLVAAGSQIHEFSNHDRDRRVAEAATASAQMGINQAVDALVSDLVYIVNKTTSKAVHEASKDRRGRAKTGRSPGAPRSSAGETARTRSSAGLAKLRDEARTFIENNPQCHAAQIARALGTTNTPEFRAVIQELRQAGTVARAKGRVTRSSPTR
ncbi:DUF6334 family protein [Sorangium sp. So ce176]|uniref:DUF6334 family protein n=1 Tax=Sorangium sp. So ce176 TaxID=3133286 RepID=UPI003F60D918